MQCKLKAFALCVIRYWRVAENILFNFNSGSGLFYHRQNLLEIFLAETRPCNRVHVADVVGGSDVGSAVVHKQSILRRCT